MNDNFSEVFAFRMRHEMSNEHAYNVTQDAAYNIQRDRDLGNAMIAAGSITTQVPFDHSEFIVA